MKPDLHVVAGLLLRTQDVLLARRGPTMELAGCWEFPGGKLEAGEDAPTALVRELQEELGIVARPLRWLATARVEQPGRMLVLEGWLAEIVSGEPEAREHDALRWQRPHEIDARTLAPADLPLLEALRALEGRG